MLEFGFLIANVLNEHEGSNRKLLEFFEFDAWKIYKDFSNGASKKKYLSFLDQNPPNVVKNTQY